MNYIKIYNNLIKKRQDSPSQDYTEKHHIIPKCMGGVNNKDNIVNLTAREHYIAHKLLTKIYPEVDKLKYALLRFVHGNSEQRVVSSKEYDKIKKILQPINSKQFKKVWEDNRDSMYKMLYDRNTSDSRRKKQSEKSLRRWADNDYKSTIIDKVKASRQTDLAKKQTSEKSKLDWRTTRKPKQLVVWKSILICKSKPGQKSYYEKGEFVGVFDYQNQAAQLLGIRQQNIPRHLKGNSPQVQGYIFEYKDE